MDKFKEIRPIVLGLAIKDNKILVAEGYDDVKKQTFYRCLGGGIEFLECSKDALKREIQEELNVSLRVNDLFFILEYDYPDFHLVMKCYYAQIIGGEMELLEHNDVKWVTKKDFKDIKFLPADLIVANNINF